MKIINLKKYKNRKIYAPTGEVSEKGVYLNLKEIAGFIKIGDSIKVTDNETGEDITNAVLKEILVRESIGDSEIYERLRK